MKFDDGRPTRRSVLKGMSSMLLAGAGASRVHARTFPDDAKNTSSPYVEAQQEQTYRTHIPTRPAWPNGAKTIMTIQVHTDGPGLELGSGHTPQGIWGWGFYPLRAGIERQLELFANEEVKATFCVPGYDCLIKPELYRRIVAEGHEISMHGYYHLRSEAKPDDLRKTHQIISDVTGVAPVGMSAPGGYKQPDTLAVLQELGCIYDGSEKDDDLPYLATIHGVVQKNMVILPNYTQTLDDAKQYAGEQTQSEVLDAWTTELDTLHETTGYYPFMYHADSGWGTGTPDRTWTVARTVLQKAKKMPGVKIMTLRKLAELCLSNSKLFHMHPGDNSA